jgi:L-alanine-DL-glutamate epimerase-like enolase superfamily enzyme
VPWYDELVTHKPDIKDGHLVLSARPGWGSDVNEAAVRAHPPKKR